MKTKNLSKNVDIVDVGCCWRLIDVVKGWQKFKKETSICYFRIQVLKVSV